MFLRRNRRIRGGDSYDYWTLCQSVRTPRGPRQRVVAHLGKLESDQPDTDWADLEALLEGRPPPPRQGDLFGNRTAPRWERVDVAGVRVERTREFGAPYLALALWRRLGLPALLERLLPN